MAFTHAPRAAVDFPGAPRATRMNRFLNTGEVFGACYAVFVLLFLYLYVCLDELCPALTRDGALAPALWALLAVGFLSPFVLRLAANATELCARAARREAAGEKPFQRLRRALIAAVVLLAALGAAALGHAILCAPEEAVSHAAVKALDMEW